MRVFSDKAIFALWKIDTSNDCMIPNFKEYFYPFMLFVSDGNKHRIAEIRDYISTYFELTADDLAEKTKSGIVRHTSNCSWAATYLKKMRLVSLENKQYTITKLGLEIFQKAGTDFSMNTLRDMQGFSDFQKKADRENGYWVPGHYTATGKYVAGYVSRWEYKGRQRRFSEDEIKEHLEKQKNKNKHK